MTMLRSFGWLAAGLLGFTAPAQAPAHAQEQRVPKPVPSVEAPASDAPASGPALWRLSDEDTTIYLFGTVHLLPKDAQWRYPALDKALASADTFVTEIGNSANAQVQILPLIQQLATLPKGETLRGLMDDDQRATYEKAMTGFGLPVATFDQYKPWFATINLSMLPLMKAGYSPDSGVEKALEAIVSPDAKSVALETAEQQLRIFDSLPQDAQLAYLNDTAEEIGQAVPMLNDMVREWIAGDPEALARLMNDSFKDDPALGEKLLYGRNATWADWIVARMAQPGTVFIAVGAGHLAGQRSVQDALARRGFTVTRIH